MQIPVGARGGGGGEWLWMKLIPALNNSKTSDELITILRDSRGLESGLSEIATFL